MTFQEALRAAAAPGTIVHDRGERGSVTGLQVKVNASGSKSFVFYYRTRQGRERRPKLGDVAEISVGEARRRAKAILDQVAAGRDPKGDWEAAKVEMTVGELYALCMQHYWAPSTTSARAKDVALLWKNHLERPFGALRLSEVTVSGVRAWLETRKETPRVGNMALSVLSRLYGFAAEREILPQGVNPCAVVKPFPARRRRRFASPEELRAIYSATIARRYENPRAAAFILILMFSGARPTAAVRARWEDLVVVERGGETFGVIKFHGKGSYETGEAETLILPPQVMALVMELPRVEGETITGLASVPKRFWNQIRKDTGIKDLWARDLRRTFGTVALSSGTSIDKIGEIMNHRSVQSTKIYTDLLATARVDAVSSVAASIEKLLLPAK